MEVNQDLVQDDIKVINCVTNSLRACRLQSYRERVVNSRKRKDCFLMKKEIIELQVKKKNLLKKKKKLQATTSELEKKFSNGLSFNLPLNYATSAMKTQILQKKQYIAKLKAKAATIIQRHQDKWKVTEAAWKNFPRIKKYEELRAQILTLEEEKSRSIQENNSKNEAAINKIREFQKSVVEFVQMVLTYQRTIAISAGNKDLENKVNTLKTTIAELKLKQEKILDQEMQLPENNDPIQRFAGIDFVDFDDSSSVTIAEPAYQDTFGGDPEYEDFNCSALSLDTSMDHSMLTASLGPSMETPVAASTPYSLEAARQVAEEEEAMQSTTHTVSCTGLSQQTTQSVDAQMGDPITQNQFIEEHHEIRGTQEYDWRNEKLGNAENVAERPLRTMVEDHQRNLVITSSEQGYSGRAASMEQVRAPAYTNVNMVSQKIINHVETGVCPNQLHTDYDEEVDYNAMYAKSPEDSRSHADPASSPPPNATQPPIPAFNFFDGNQGASNPMSFFSFGPSEQKTASSSIFNLF